MLRLGRAIGSRSSIRGALPPDQMSVPGRLTWRPLFQFGSSGARSPTGTVAEPVAIRSMLRLCRREYTSDPVGFLHPRRKLRAAHSWCPKSCGSRAMLAATRRASSSVRTLACIASVRSRGCTRRRALARLHRARHSRRVSFRHARAREGDASSLGQRTWFPR